LQYQHTVRMSDDLTHNPHDRFFRETFSHKETAVAFFKEFLPAEIVEAVDWDTLKDVPCSFIEETLRESRSDLLFEVSFLGQPLNLYCLFEHQSTQDKRMPLRLLGYMVRIWERFAKENLPSQALPPIVPIILHQSLDRWEVPLRFCDSLAIPQSLRAIVQGYQPDFCYQLIDLPAIGDLQKIDLSLAVIFQIMRTVEEKNILEAMDTVMRFMADVCKQRNDMSFLRTCMNYLFRADTNVDKQALIRKLETIENTTIKEQTMSIADVLIEHGRQEGIEKGRQEAKEALIRQIGTLQDILGKRTDDPELLSKLTIQELELQLEKIQSELRTRLK